MTVAKEVKGGFVARGIHNPFSRLRNGSKQETDLEEHEDHEPGIPLSERFSDFKENVQLRLMGIKIGTTIRIVVASVILLIVFYALSQVPAWLSNDYSFTVSLSQIQVAQTLNLYKDITPPGRLPHLFAYTSVYAPWIFRLALVVASYWLVWRERKKAKESVPVFAVGIPVLALSLLLGGHAENLGNWAIHYLGSDAQQLGNHIHTFIALIIAFFCLRISIVKKDLTVFYGCMLTEAILFKMFRPTDPISMTFSLIALTAGFLELYRQGKGWGILFSSLGRSLMVIFLYVFFYNMIIYLSAVLSGLAGLDMTPVIYNNEIISLVPSLAVSYLATLYLWKGLNWVSGSKYLTLSELADRNSDANKAMDNYLFMLTVIFFVMLTGFQI